MSTMRSPGVDGVRILGLLAVVVGHVWPNSALVNRGVYTWHVPLFFFLAGWFGVPERSLRAEARSRWRSLLVPYLTWLGVIGFFVLLQDFCSTEAHLSKDVVRMLAGGEYLTAPFSAFWFMTALTASVLLVRATRRVPRWWLAVGAAGALTIADVAPQVLAAVPLGVGVALPATVFILAGRCIACLAGAVTRPTLIGGLLLATGASAVVIGVRPLDVKHGDFGDPLISVLVAIMLCAGLTIVSSQLDSFLRRGSASCLSELAKVGSGVVLTHSFVVWVAEGWMPRLVVAFMAVVLPWTAMILVHRTRVSPFFLGVPRRVRPLWRDPDASAS